MKIQGLEVRTFSDSSRLEFIPELQIDGAIGFWNIRRERTGIHAMVSILVNGSIVMSDTFNIGRAKDRDSLVKLAKFNLSDIEQEAWKSMSTHVMTACIWVATRWEASTITSGSAEVEPSESTFPIYPYIIRNGGSILFAPPGSGKSYLLQTMAITTAVGRSGLWEQEQSPVIYINLERSKDSVERREFAIRRALGLQGSTGVQYVHARGRALSGIAPHVKNLVDRYPNSVVMLDSLSRAGIGSLTEDQTANQFVDTMNSFGTWIAIGHTPRADSDHVYGSQHFDAGQDIGIKVSSERKDNLLGVALRVTKANDIPPVPLKILVFQFREDGHGLENIGLADHHLFPTLLADKKMSAIESLIAFMGDEEWTTTDVSSQLGLTASWVSERFLHSGLFIQTRTDKHKKFYRVKEAGAYQNPSLSKSFV